jgi:hypothetical protein
MSEPEWVLVVLLAAVYCVVGALVSNGLAAVAGLYRGHHSPDVLVGYLMLVIIPVWPLSLCVLVCRLIIFPPPARMGPPLDCGTDWRDVAKAKSAEEGMLPSFHDPASVPPGLPPGLLPTIDNSPDPNLVAADPVVTVPRDTVYFAIDTERDYQDRLWGDAGTAEQPGPGRRRLDEFGTYVSGYAVKLVLSQSTEAKLEAVRRLAALCVWCMEQHGAPLRPSLTGPPEAT